VAEEVLGPGWFAAQRLPPKTGRLPPAARQQFTPPARQQEMSVRGSFIPTELGTRGRGGYNEQRGFDYPERHLVVKSCPKHAKAFAPSRKR
jgi:hypothetical protein